MLVVWMLKKMSCKVGPWLANIWFLIFDFFYLSVAYYCCIAKELQTELQELCPVDPMIYQPLYEMAQVIVWVIMICDSVSAVLLVILIAIAICYEWTGLVKLDWTEEK
jgi:hypothetical protein